MATTQIKPAASGSFTNVTLAGSLNCAKSTIGVSALPPGYQQLVLHATNVFHNTSGQGTSAARAQKVIKAAGFLLQWA